MNQETQSSPLEEALKRAYYYDENDQWRGPEHEEWERWHAVAKVATEAARALNVDGAERPNVAIKPPVLRSA